MNFDTLAYVAENIIKRNIRWGLGGSLVLHHYGLVVDSNDIDIIVAIEDAEVMDEVLQSIGHKKEKEATITYQTEIYHKYLVKDMDIDVMGNFTIKHSHGKYVFPFEVDSITGYKEMQGLQMKDLQIPLTSLEDWYIIYQLIPNRENKVRMIEDHFIKNGIKAPQLLQRNLEKCLPPEVVERTEDLLRKCQA